jgi:Lrp/AsnC family transcriptional regulator for asnA, asnC and gidA
VIAGALYDQPVAEQIAIDQLDRDIMRLLQEDGRKSFREIARQLETSEGTVRARVRRLKDAEVLRFLALVDPSALGQSMLVVVLVHLHPGQHDEVVAALVDLPEVGYVATTFGRCDLILEVLATSSEEAWHFVNYQLRTLSGVASVEPTTILKVHKYKYEPNFI